MIIIPRRRGKMGRLCRTCKGEMKNAYKILMKNRRDHFGDIDIDERIMDLEENGVDWIHLAQDSVQWQAFLIMRMIFD
jgi:hypothetical protein